MILIPCPLCGYNASTEFVYLDEHEAAPTAARDISEARRSTYYRRNERGETDELWQHASGCRQVIVIRRHRLTNDILESRLLRDATVVGDLGLR
jgi:heterotetrameric sarcosine oxidase delta subunit